MGKFMFLMILITACVIYKSATEASARREEQMRTVYTAMCGDNTFDVRFRTATSGDLITLDGRRVQLSEESCTVVVKYIEKE